MWCFEFLPTTHTTRRIYATDNIRLDAVCGRKLLSILDARMAKSNAARWGRSLSCIPHWRIDWEWNSFDILQMLEAGSIIYQEDPLTFSSLRIYMEIDGMCEKDLILLRQAQGTHQPFSGLCIQFVTFLRIGHDWRNQRFWSFRLSSFRRLWYFLDKGFIPYQTS